uniref:IMP-specific 5'-nucleotidase 1 n=1 Tax=Globisporangium ultimum (strain ATCC 200006 / CBS 805.95 / DAOM BR144) TaxID=431595 RepID=K3X834_GLOUD
MLKEQDPMIELIREWIMAPVDESAGLHLSVAEVFQVVQDMIAEHVVSPETSRLKKYLPRIKKIFLPLDLTRAAKEYDARTHFLSRKHVPPTFKEVRHILNLATIHAIADHLKLVTFDADDTIYEDGGVIHSASKMVIVIVELLKRGIVVSLVTAAGYPGKPERYEERLRGILDALEALSAEERARFLVMGGECNYLLETYTHDETGKLSLREIPGHLWKDGRGERWKEHDVQQLLDVAERVLRETTELLHLPAAILRKDRAIGIINTSQKRFMYEDLEEICLTVQHELQHFSVPFCAFNGGNDVWVDIGNKALGIQALQKYVLRFLPKELQGEELTKIQGRECLHVGDRFTSTGNDTRSRDASTTVWISNPSETVHIMKKLLKAIDAARAENKDSTASESAGGTKGSTDQLDATVEAAISAATQARTG